MTPTSTLHRKNVARRHRHSIVTALVMVLIPITAWSAAPQSSFLEQTRVFGGLRVDDYTDAPQSFISVLRLDAPPSEVFAVIGNHSNVEEWVPGVARSWIDDRTSEHALGNVEPHLTRSCQFEEDVLTEDIVYWDPASRTYAYAINFERTSVGYLPFHEQLGVMTVEAGPDGGSILTWRQYWKAGNFIERTLMFPVLRRLTFAPAVERLLERFGGEELEPRAA